VAKLGTNLKKTILIVDDDSDTRSLLLEILEADGYDVVQAGDGLEALERLKTDPVDLVITDRAMPKMDGMALLARLREERSQLPVLMISGYGEETFWSQAIGLGAVDYILKPFRQEDVVASVQKVFHGGKKK
jgi:DNA-binding response OmpR family regulator